MGCSSAPALVVFLASVALLMPRLGNHGARLTMLLFMAARGLWPGACYLYIERGAGFVAAPARSRAT
jgi:hypothetical protein